MRKIRMLELDFTNVVETFVSYSAGIYQKRLTLSQAGQDASFWSTAFSGTWDIDEDPVTVGSVTVDNNILGSVDSVDELREQDGSFYFDTAKQTLYLALYDYANAWYYRKYKDGETTAFISEAQRQMINGVCFPVDTYVGAQHIEPRLESDISVSESIDDQSDRIFKYDDSEASINNSDGAYDNIRDEVTGNEMRLYIADLADSPEEALASGVPYKLKADIDDFNLVRATIVDDVDYSDPNAPTISGTDIKADWEQKIGQSILTTDDYPDIEDKYVNKRAPLAMGEVNGVEAIPLADEPETSSSFDFLVHDVIVGDLTWADDDAVFYLEDGEINGSDYDGFLTASMYDYDETTGILTVYNYDDGDIFTYGTFGTRTNAVDILLFLLDEYANLAFIASNFNINEIEEIRALGYETHVYIDKSGDELNGIIAEIVNDIQCDFFQQGDTFTLRRSNEERISTEAVETYELLDDPVPWVNDRYDTIKTVSVNYAWDYRTDEYTTYYNDDLEQDAIDLNRSATDEEIDVHLTNATQVDALYGSADDGYYGRFSVPRRTITINRAIPFTAGLTDFVTCKVTRITADGENDVFPRAKYKIVEIDQNDNTAEAVYFSDSPEPYTSQGSLTFLGGCGLAYQAPSAAIITEPYQGELAYAELAYSGVASATGVTGQDAPPDQSGCIAGITQTIGE